MSGEKKKVIYILGCGRSGSTITGFVLGNGDRCLDLGEVIYFLRTKGHPNEFDETTDNGRFWKQVREGVEHDVPEIFGDEHAGSLMKLESYRAFPRLFLGLFSERWLRPYREYLNSLYRHIAASASGSDVFIDSSKAAGRALLYTSLLSECEVYLLHLVRSPVGVVKSMTKKDGQPGSCGYLTANFYYFSVQLCCLLLRLKTSRSRFLRVRYEDLQDDPTGTLRRISEFADVDLRAAESKVVNGQALERGFVFNGNRMRMNDSIKLKLGANPDSKTIGNRITRLVNACWY
jgi:hypothetical protein